MLPTSPWEAIWQPLAQWIGVQDANLVDVMPNLQNFPTSSLPTQQDIFT